MKATKTSMTRATKRTVSKGLLNTGWLLIALLAMGLTALALLLPATAYAHHPGIIGPVSHLGTDTVVRVVLAAVLDGINPSALGVLLLLCRRALLRGEKPAKTVLAYVGGILLVYIAAGVLLRTAYLNFGPSLPIMLFQIAIAGLLFLSGLHELIAAIKPEKARLIEVPPAAKSFMEKLGVLLDRGLALPLGIFIGILELFATGAIYLSFIQAITYDPTAPKWVLVVMMAIYLTAFLAPLVLAYSYRGLLARDKDAGNQRGARIAKGIIGGFFMAAALFIAASAIVTIQAL